jgi:hypothetical protein
MTCEYWTAGDVRDQRGWMATTTGANIGPRFAAARIRAQQRLGVAA